MSSWDGLIGDMQRAQDIGRLRRHYEALLENANSTGINNDKVANKMMDLAAGHLSMRGALATQLANYDPKHPLLHDDSLIERIKEAGTSAFRISNLDFEAARDVGKTFAIPGYEKPKYSPFAKAAISAATVRTLADLPPLQATAPAPAADQSVYSNPAFLELQQQYAASLSLRSALSEVLRQADPDHPLLKDHMLQERIRKAGISAFVLGKLDFNAARSAGTSFVLPGTPGALNKSEPSS